MTYLTKVEAEGIEEISAPSEMFAMRYQINFARVKLKTNINPGKSALSPTWSVEEDVWQRGKKTLETGK